MNQILTFWDFGVILATFLIAWFIAYRSYQKMGLTTNILNERIGNPKWDFSSSWATTLTTVGALLGTVVSTSALKDATIQSGLSLFFGLVALVAPLLYSASVERLPLNPPTENATHQYQGTVQLFLISSTLTVWAVSGELVTIATSFYALQIDNLASIPALVAFGIVLALALLCTYRYAYKSIPWTILDQLATKRSRQLRMHKTHDHAFTYEENAEPLQAFEKLSPEVQKDVKSYNPPAKNWSLL